jgi:uncharacterized membrane protein
MLHKRRTLIFLVSGMALLFIVATSLPNLRLLAGEPFVLPPLLMMRPTLLGGMADVTILFFRLVIALLVFGLPVAVIWCLLDRRRLKQLVVYLASLGLIYWLLTSFVPQERALQLDNLLRPVAPPAAASPGEGQAPSQCTAGPSETTVWIVTFVVVMLILALAGALIWWISKRRSTSPRQALANEAQDALAALQAGGPLEATIERCYREMCMVLQRDRNVLRNASMTPSEFVQTLRRTGLPIAPFQQLTHLFEDLRYGAGKPGLREEQQAIESLSAIVAACGGAR